MKKALVNQPVAVFEIRNSNSYSRDHMPLPPQPHHSHPVQAMSSSDNLYLTPMEVRENVDYAEIKQASNNGYASVMTNGVTAHLLKNCVSGNSSLMSSPAGSQEALMGACGGVEHDDTASASIPLVSAQQETTLSISQSEESLLDMSGSLVMKTSTTVHNDYVDMNGSPVAPSKSAHDLHPDKTTYLHPIKTLEQSSEQSSQCKASLSHNKGSSQSSSNASQPKESSQAEGKSCEGEESVDYSNLMSASQRSENIYEPLR